MVHVVIAVLLIIYLNAHWAWWIVLALALGFDCYMNVMPYLKLMREVDDLEAEMMKASLGVTLQDMEPEVEQWPH